MVYEVTPQAVDESVFSTTSIKVMELPCSGRVDVLHEKQVISSFDEWDEKKVVVEAGKTHSVSLEVRR